MRRHGQILVVMLGQAVVLALAATGCLQIAEFKPPGPGDAGGDSGVDGNPATPPTGVTAQKSDGVIVMTGAFYELVFSSGGAGFPSSLRIAGQQNLLQPTAECEQSGMGIQVDPAFVVDATRGSGTAEIVYAGGAVAQVRVPWTHVWQCDGATNTASGTSTFTGYPDGRIVRHDQMAFAGSDTVMTTNCTCNPGHDITSFSIRSYATLRDDGFPLEPPPPTGTGAVVQPIGTSYQVCASGTKHSFLYGFEGASARLRRVQGSPNGIGHGLSYELFVQGFISSTSGGDLALGTMLLSPTPATCPALTDRMLALRDDIAIRVTHPEVPSTLVMFEASPVSGIYESMVAGASVPDRVEIRAAIGKTVPAAFVIALRFAGPRTKVTTSLPVSKVLVSKPSPDVALIFVTESLSDTTPISVTAEP